MWFSVVWTLVYDGMRHHGGQNYEAWPVSPYSLTLILLIAPKRSF